MTQVLSRLVLAAGIVAASGLCMGAGQQGSEGKPRTWEERVPPAASPPPLTVHPPAFEAGDLRPREEREATFTLTNTGDREIQFGDVRATCWCAAGQLSKRTLAPGESATLHARLEAPAEPGPIDRAIFVFVQGYAQPAAIALRADVNYGIRYRVEPDEEHPERAVVHLESVDGAPFRVISAGQVAPVFVDGFEPETDQPRSAYAISYGMQATAPVAIAPPWFLVETDHPDSPVIDLPLPEYQELRRLRPWTMSERRILLGTMLTGESQEFTVTLRGVRGDALTVIEDLRLEPEGRHVTLMGLAPAQEGLRARLRFIAGDTEGLICARLVVLAEGHEEELYLFGRAVGR